MTRHEQVCPQMLRYRPPRIAMSLLLVATALQLLLHTGLPGVPPAPLAAATVASLGFGIMLRAWWLFRRHDTAICPTADATALITRDIYRVSRNPMYLGIVLMLLGIAIATDGLFYYLAALAFFVIMEFVFCPYEERKLARRFGRDFAAYAGRVRRWL